MSISKMDLPGNLSAISSVGCFETIQDFRSNNSLSALPLGDRSVSCYSQVLLLQPDARMDRVISANNAEWIKIVDDQ